MIGRRTTPPVRLLRKTGRPRIDYRQFCLFDVESHRYSQLGLPYQEGDEIAVSGDGGARFFTLGELTDVLVDFELWTAEPAMPKQQYERRYDGELTVDTGRLTLGCTTGSPEDVMIDLPTSGSFGLRAFRTSQAASHPDFPDLDHHDEQWLIQVWPVG